MNVRNQRLIFADFLERLALGNVNSEEWQTLVVNHYFDDLLEEIRSQLVRLTIQFPETNIWSGQEKTQLLIWANKLRSSN